MKIKFENLHPTKKHAFLDGFLCGLCVAFMASGPYKDFREDRRLKKLGEMIGEELRDAR